MKAAPNLIPKLRFAFGAVLLVLLAVGVISYHSLIASADTEQWIQHTHDVIEHLQSLSSMIADIQTGYGGFALTGEEVFLQPARADIPLVGQEEEALRALTADNPYQQLRLTALAGLAEQIVQDSKTLIRLRQAGDPKAAADVIRQGHGERNLDEFRAVIRDMEDQERHLLLERNAKAQRSFRQTKAAIFLGSILGLLIPLGAGWIVRRDYGALLRAEAKYRGLLEAAPDAIVVVNERGEIPLLNLQAEKQFGYQPDELLGQQVTNIIPEGFAERLVADGTRSPAEALSQQIDTGIELTGRRKDGSEFPIEIMLSPLESTEGVLVTAAIRNVSAAREMSRQITHSAQHDFLTGLPNQILMNDRIGQAIAFAKRHTKKSAVLLLDLDGFKHINDSLGHPIGDKMLQSIAKRLIDCVRGSDTVSRQGGDEFVVLLSELEQSDDAAIIARRMLQTVADVHSIDHHDLHVTASIGVSIYPDDGPDAETLIRNAETAMYQAKENGPQSCNFFKLAMNVRAVERQSIEEALRTALERHEFTLYYQPKVNLRTGEIAGAEALIRWKHPTLGQVPPGQFISVAEQSGLILPIGDWVFREACTQAQAWISAGLPLASVAVNISAIQFRDEEFLQRVLGILEDSGLSPRSLELELTESVLMKRPELTELILKRLREKGVRVAVDDFGTGYSSLSYLRKFPIDTLKIDQSFIRQITTVPTETAIVAAIISMGQSLNLCVIAEGVETREELAFLRAHQCEEAQGYYFSRPVPAEQFAELLKSGISETIPY